MSRLPFEYWRDGDVFWARFASDETRPLLESWSGLDDSEILEDLDYAPYRELAIGNVNREEVAAYLRLVWSALNGRDVLGNAYYYSGEAATLLTQEGSVVRWQFEVDSAGLPGNVDLKG